MAKKRYYWKGPGCVTWKPKNGKREKITPGQQLPDGIGDNFILKHFARSEVEIRDYAVVTKHATDNLDDIDETDELGEGMENESTKK
jgi:hypothetical protein